MAKNQAKLQKEQKLLRQQQRAAEEKARRKKERKILIIAVSVFLVFVIGVSAGVVANKIAIDSGKYYRERIALSGEHHEITGNMFSCFAYDAFLQFQEREGDVSYYGLDVSLPLEDQFKENGTWEQYFIDLALEDCPRYLFLADNATKDGFTLDAEKLKNIDTQVAAITDFSVYGRGISAEDFKAAITLKALAEAYAEHKEASFSYSDDAINQHYTDYQIQYDSMDYVTLVIDYGESYAVKDVDSARELADQIIKTNPFNKDTLKAAAELVYNNNSITTEGLDEAVIEQTKVTLNTVGEDFANWAKTAKAGDPSVMVGDTYVEISIVTRELTKPEDWKEKVLESMRSASFDGWYADNYALYNVGGKIGDLAKAVQI